MTSYGDFNCAQFGADARVDPYLDFLELDAAPAGPVEVEDPCQGETFEGRCHENVVVWCENDSVQTSDCSAKDQTCGFSNANDYYACLDEDPCTGETFMGRCDGNTVIWCEDEAVQSIECRACGFDDAKGYYDCQ